MDVYGPTDLPRLRLHLLKMWEKGGELDRDVGAGSKFVMPGETPFRGSWGDWERNHLELADLWWVSADMTSLTQAVAANIPHETTPLDLQPPSPSGLVVFEKPWRGVDSQVKDARVQVSAMLWGGTELWLTENPGKGVPALSMSFYEKSSQATRLEFLRDYADGQEWSDRDKRVAEQRIKARNYGTDWSSLGRSDWPFMDRMDESLTDNDDDLIIGQSFIEDRAMIAAFWALIQTKGVAKVVHHPAQRQARRKYERQGFEGDKANVRVVQLRKLEPKEPEGEPQERKVDWSCQWMVDPHPRLQPYGPGRLQRKLIIVGPYLKGPSDKPLRVRQDVKAFVR